MKGRTSGSVTIGLIQMSMSGNPADNLAKAIKKIEDAAQKGAQIICLPELFKSRYFCQEEEHDKFALAESIPGETTESISKVAKKNNTAVIAGIFEKRTSGVYHNSAAVIDASGALVGIYRKMHIPDDPHYYEKFYFTPGDLGFKSYKTAYGNVGVLICWDQWYPEAARITSLMGAQILFYPTAIGYFDEEKADAHRMQDAWETIQRSHGIANGVFVAVANRVGKEDNTNFWGSSFISDPFGEIVAKASPSKEETLIAKVDLSLIDDTRHTWPFLRDRRIDAYHGITSRFLD